MQPAPANPLSRLAQDPQAAVDPVELALEVAVELDPRAEAAACRRTLEEWGGAARDRVAGAASLRGQLTAISGLLYDEFGLRGNRAEYYSAENSLLPRVVARRTGLPLTLALVYQAVARAAGVTLHGIGAPGHFVLGALPTSAAPEPLFIEPFERGDVLTLPECRRRIVELTGADRLPPAAAFRPVTSWELAVRMLRNLKTAYALADDWPHALRVQQHLARLLRDDLEELRDLGLVFLRLGRPQSAAPLLERYARHCPADQRSEIEPYLRVARRLRAELN